MMMLGKVHALALLCLASVMYQTTMATVTPMPGNIKTELTKRGGFTQFLGLLKDAGLLDTLITADNITVFAPTDAALARVPADQLAAITGNHTELQRIMGYHAVLEDVRSLNNDNGRVRLLMFKVINSSNDLPIMINPYKKIHTLAAEGVNITERAIRVSNGYFHVLGGIMIPPQGDVMEIVAANGGLTSFTTLLKSTGLVDVIDSHDYNTVFAPRDAAFARLNSEVSKFLLSDLDAQIDVLSFHFSLRTIEYSVGMFHGEILHPYRINATLMMFTDFVTGDITVNTANIVQKDISATNGVIHIIDEVLIPPGVLLKMQDNGITTG
ncbi:hypothetical protein EGW08_012657 [Elysia chlorotica]|uniref:FAS1 domain-containing protein n=1 Tax=Elysia chlorotica TaxID=188477 RepID=A0A3S1BBH8_ELYCH|nr:hypothetical protein EGW08_012657 [Elysia chlorotica]